MLLQRPRALRHQKRNKGAEPRSWHAAALAIRLKRFHLRAVDITKLTGGLKTTCQVTAFIKT